jgi:hypothetical protein
MTMRIVVSIALACAACNGGGSDELTSFSGAYTIQDWTENPTACDSAGPSILASQQNKGLMVKSVNFLGQKFVDAATCLDSDECNRFLDDNTIHLPNALDKGSDGAGWTGDFVVAFGTSTACSGDVTHAILTGAGDGVSLRLEKTTVTSFPADSSGQCSTDAATAAAAGLPCSSVQIITGVP